MTGVDRVTGLDGVTEADEMSETRAMPPSWRRTATPEMERNQWL